MRSNNRIYIVFWPEDGTWDDGAISSVSRNRTTFMRYLTKLCDQIDCLVSNEHAENFVWKDGPIQESTPDDEYSPVKDRMFGYSVQRTGDEEDSVQAEEGFLFRYQAIKATKEVPIGFPADLPPALLQPRLIYGDVNQAILRTRYAPNEVRSHKLNRIMKTTALKELLSARQSPSVILGGDIDHLGLGILLDHGLWDRCGDLREEWQNQRSKERERQEEDDRIEIRKVKNSSKAKEDLPEMTFWIATQASRLYTLLEHGIFESTSHMDVNIDAGDRDASIAKADTWLNQYPDLRQRVSDDVQSNLRILDADPNTRFNVLKRRLSQIYSLIHSEQSTFSEADIRNLADLVVLQKDKAFKSGMNRIINSTKKSSSGGLGKMFTALFPLWTNQPANPKISVQSPPSRDDPAFVEFLKKLEADEPHFQSAIIELKLLVTEMLSCKIKSLSAFVQATLIEAQKTALEEDVRTFLKERRQKEEVEAWNDLRNQVEQCLINSIPEENDGTTITINSIVREGVRIYDQPETFLVTGTRSSPYEAGFEYTIFPIEIKQDDFIAISNNFGHICKPLVRSQHARPLSVPVNFHLR
ncbi:hypothetical protein M408DRAFT_26540 [Serendipita vermifera MAFF 305830]|uniref:Uncharacterized protein n=1 Tax=Serendipita vermifera MAFF 305830 TaxID=933852 RepID=A0A0C3AK11_SERVB|nr:hypothetical protein M408DRAFT_26540 [Serendipita vermifera MAFF 305830]